MLADDKYHQFPVLVYGDMRVEYTINFNKIPEKGKRIEQQNEEIEGPVVERKCPKCGNNKMSYATLQLRSADEGQTVFYTCTQCSFKETENS